MIFRPGFPIKLLGVGQIHAAFLNESADLRESFSTIRAEIDKPAHLGRVGFIAVWLDGLKEG
jgi:hypothetical protein